MTAEKEIEAALRRAAESAERSERSKSAFLASMSHEIRTPLNGGPRSCSHPFRNQFASRAKGGTWKTIVLSGDILLSLIGDILDLSKLEAQEMKLHLKPTSLPTLVRSIAKLFQGQAKEQATTLVCNVSMEVPERVLADDVRLRQILSNLVGNAVKFTHNGTVQINTFVDEGIIAFEVRDSGIGISPDRIDTIFDRFQQAADITYGGTGLGLTISKALIQLMGGQVKVSSEPGLGSTFQVKIPLEPIAEAPITANPNRLPHFSGRRVLVVDDNRINQLVSTHVIAKFGCEVTCAENGIEALSILTQDKFDMVFMDIRMPLMNGLEATRMYRQAETENSRLPIIALSAGAFLQEQEECFEAGMDDFVSKPITFDSIRDILLRWFTPAE